MGTDRHSKTMKLLLAIAAFRLVSTAACTSENVEYNKCCATAVPGTGLSTTQASPPTAGARCASQCEGSYPIQTCKPVNVTTGDVVTTPSATIACSACEAGCTVNEKCGDTDTCDVLKALATLIIVVIVVCFVCCCGAIVLCIVCFGGAACCAF